MGCNNYCAHYKKGQFIDRLLENGNIEVALSVARGELLCI